MFQTTYWVIKCSVRFPLFDRSSTKCLIYNVLNFPTQCYMNGCIRLRNSRFCLEYKLIFLVKIDFARNSGIVFVFKVNTSSDNIALLAVL